MPDSMTREEFITAMGGQKEIDRLGYKVIECNCDHECCSGWNVERVADK